MQDSNHKPLASRIVPVGSKKLSLKVFDSLSCCLSGLNGHALMLCSLTLHLPNMNP